jgi:RND family efflux transporter MFP subunit
MRKFLTKRNMLILVILLLIGGWWWNGQNKAKNGKEIREASVTRGEVVSSISVSGEITANKKAILNFSSTGRVSYLGVSEGDEVKKYQLLAYLDPGDLETAVTRTYYAYLSADANAKKIEDDMKNKGASETFAEKNTRVAAQTVRDTAYDAWLAAQRAVRNAKLTAPFAGKVTAMTFDAVGDTATVTDGITIVDPESLYFSAEVDEQDVGRVGLGQTVKVKLDAFDDQVLSGEISDIGFVAQTSSTGATVYPVKMAFGKEMLSKLRIGMNGDAEIIFEVKENVLKLPLEAVTDGEVMQKTESGEKSVKVETGIEGELDIEIISGLQEGDKVLVK